MKKTYVVITVICLLVLAYPPMKEVIAGGAWNQYQ
jgi:hypothetical protein